MHTRHNLDKPNKSEAVQIKHHHGQKQYYADPTYLGGPPMLSMEL